ncbi:MAG: hypothetical protein NXI14_04935 [bacterium]|nr:hypothetical protein [bacterium]
MEPASADPDPTVSPTIECRRCGTRFVCEWPEVSGAVRCSVCENVASLSKPDLAKVVGAASERRRRGLPTSPTHAAAETDDLGDSPEDALRRQARRARANADRCCPECLYDITGLCEHWNDVRACPECGERLSPRLVVERWIERGRRIRRFTMVSGWGGVVAGGLFPLFVIVLGYTLGRWAWGGWLMFVAVVAYILLASSLVFMSGFEWMRLRNPLARKASLIGLAIAMVAANFIAAVIVAALSALLLAAVLSG